ncbi:hypothetical protein KUL150_35670 [Alteromonas sp. KUL150]|nr:hypothetical protein KUL150_35670 [Alteromonas sp. KUL150]
MGKSSGGSGFIHRYTYYAGGLCRRGYIVAEISVMKNFLIALVIAIVLMNCLGSLVDSWLGMHLIMSDELLSPWENVAVLSLIGVALAIVGFVVAVSVIGTILLALGAGFLALLVMGVSAFWPIILIVIALYALKNRNSAAYKQQNERNMHHTL